MCSCGYTPNGIRWNALLDAAASFLLFFFADVGGFLGFLILL